MDFAVHVTGEREVGLSFDQFPDNLRALLKHEIESLTEELLAGVEVATPSLTGRLRSQERARIYNDPNRIRGVVGIGSDDGNDYAKAGALEWGAHRQTHVKAHEMKLDHAWANMLSAPMDVMVAAYDRTPNIAEHMFGRGPLASMQAEIIERLDAAVDQAVAKVNE